MEKQKHIFLESIAGLITAIGAYLSPLFLIFALVCLVACIDNAVAIWKVVKLKEKLKIWQGIKQTASKILLYSLICLAVHSLDAIIVNEFWVSAFKTKFLLLKGVALLLCIMELKSISRNYKKVKGIDLIEMFYSIIKEAREMVQKLRSFNKTAIILILVLVGSCVAINPIRKHDRIVKKYPFVHTFDSIEQKEKIKIVVEKSEKDTSFVDRWLTKYDTITTENERMKIKYIKDGDTVYLKGECKPLEIVREIKVKTPVLIEKTFLKWWQYPTAIFVFCLVALGIGKFINYKQV